MKRRPPSRFILMDDLTQVVLGWYASEEEAYRSPEWASAAHPVVVPITDDPSAEADEAAYTAALRAMAVARREAQVRAVEARGWTSTGDVWVSPDGRTRYVPGRDVWESWRWLPDVPGGDLYASGEEPEAIGGYAWTAVPAPDWAAAAAEAAQSAIPLPAAPQALYVGPTGPQAQPDHRPAWAAIARARWCLADAARRRRDWAAMRRWAEAAQQADEYASPSGALGRAIFGGAVPAPGPSAQQELEAGQRIRPDVAAEAARAVRAEIEAHREHQRARQAEARAAARASERAMVAEARAAQRADAEALIGQVLTGRRTYRLRKAVGSDVLAVRDGQDRQVLVRVQGLPDRHDLAVPIRILRWYGQRLYGKFIALEGELTQ